MPSNLTDTIDAETSSAPQAPVKIAKAFAAAQAVASAARDLGEREAAFGRNDLIRTALERGGPVTVADIEARIETLEDKGLLIVEGGTHIGMYDQPTLVGAALGKLVPFYRAHL